MTRKHKLPVAIFAVFAMTLTLLVYFPSGAFSGFDMGITANAAWDGTAAEDFAGGDGSADSPFEIATGEQLAYFEKQVNGGENYAGKYIKLTADIDLGGREWTPIGSDTLFKGSFDGDGHSVSNFIIDKSDEKYVGLFNYNSGTIKNLGVKNAKVTGSDYVGSICGYNTDDGTVLNCYNTGTVSGSSYVGGICGNNYGTIQNCYNTGTVSGGDYVGGICGTAHKGSIINCYNTGAVNGDKYAGGICGINCITITNCYNTGSVSEGNFVGGVCGMDYSGTVTNCYNAGAVSGKSYIGGVCGMIHNSTITNCYYNKDVCTESAE